MAFDPTQMPTTPRHGIRYPSQNDLVKYASQQFAAMAESIDDNIDKLPAQITDTVTQAATDTKKWRDEAQQFAATSGTLQDNGLAALIRRNRSATRAALYGGSCLFIGDSYTQGFRVTNTANRWTTLVSARLGWQESNYGVGGSGFNGGGDSNRPFLAQAQKAKADGVNPDVIIVAGGRNDGATAIGAKAKAVFDYLRVTWPTARLVTIPVFWGDYRPVGPDEMARANEIRQAASDTGNVQVIWNSWQWMYGHPEWAYNLGGGNLDMHPNDTGYAQMAGHVIEALQGGPTTVSLPVQNLPVQSSSSNVDATVDIVDGMVHIKGRFNGNGNVYAGWAFTTLPGPARPGSTRYVLGWTNTGATPCLIGIGTDGVCAINNIYGSAGPNVAFVDLTYPMAVK